MALLQISREPTAIAFSTISLVIFLTFFLIKKKLKKKRYNLPPSPPKLPIIGNLHQLGSSKNVPPISLRNLARKYGPIMQLQLGEISTMIISSARLAQEVLKVHDIPLANRPRLVAAEYLYIDHMGLAFSPYNAYWRYARKVFTLEVLSAKKVQSYFSIRKEQVSNLIRWISEHYPGKVNFSKMAGMSANDVLCRAALGRDFSGGGDSSKHAFHEFHEMLEEYQELLGGLSIGDFFPSMEFLIMNFTGMKSRLVHTMHRFDKLFDRIIAEHQDPNREKGETKDFVDVLLDAHKNETGEMSLTMENIKSLILVSESIIINIIYIYIY